MNFLSTTWRKMMERCYDTRCHAYGHYGARGVIVCDRWHNQDAFFEDMGYPPDAENLVTVIGDSFHLLRSQFTVDRIDPHGNYEPGNCRWADSYTQANNKRNKSGGIVEKRGRRYRARIRMFGLSMSATFGSEEEAHDWLEKTTSGIRRDYKPAVNRRRHLPPRGVIEERDGLFRARVTAERTFESEQEARQWMEATLADLCDGDDL